MAISTAVSLEEAYWGWLHFKELLNRSVPKALPPTHLLDGAEENHRFAPFALFGERLAHLARGSSLIPYRLSAKRRKGNLHLKA